ncbi:DUF6022 family protein [Alteribacter populi]|uniref:DUF6022 family protein n=1 Tax=Alteribacter populi TaxID=2011011 RepID=UPI000BBAF5A4|nr:DUF6022 family protein [Alteribacter populi]
MTKLNVKPDLLIEELGEVLTAYIKDHWERVLEENKEELLKLYPEYEDATYGIYLDKLLPPVWGVLEKNGFQSAEETKEDDFIIGGCLNFRNSIEKAHWGTPSHEIRVFWIVIENQHREQIGTLIFELPHSHVEFDLPAPPKVTVFEGTERREITQKIRELKGRS